MRRTFVVTVVVDHLTGPHHIITDDDAARSSKLQYPLQVLWIGLLVCINEDQVEGSSVFGFELQQGDECLTDPDIDLSTHTRPIDVRLRDLGLDFSPG